MKIILLFLIIVLAKCDTTAQEVDFSGQYWIPRSVNWKSPTSGIPEIDQRKTEGFKTIYFTSDCLFYIVSSEQELLDNDSLAYGIEPGFSIYRGVYSVKGSFVFVRYSQIHGSFMIDDKHLKDTLTLSDKDGEKTLLFNNKYYILTNNYTSYSRNKIQGQIRIAEDLEIKKM